MTTRSEEPEVVAEEEVAKPKNAIIIIMSVLLGALLTVLIAGAVFHFQNSAKLQAEIAAAKRALKEKTQELDETRTQIEALFKQLSLLKDSSAARSHSPTEEGRGRVSTAPAGAAADAPAVGVTDEKAIPPASPAAPTKVKKPKPASDNCDLVGKTPEEQAATLKRCVNLMDSPGEKPRSR